MKARLPVPKSYRKQINDLVRDASEEHLQTVKLEHSRRTIKLCCVVLNKHFGFGKKRILRFIDAMGTFTLERSDDPVYWKHIDDRLIDEIKLDFERENYEEMDE